LRERIKGSPDSDEAKARNLRADRITDMENAHRKYQAMKELRSSLEHVKAEHKKEREEFERLWDHKLEGMRAKWADELRLSKPDPPKQKKTARFGTTRPNSFFWNILRYKDYSLRIVNDSYSFYFIS
jgi:hypothetical protein